MKYSPTATVELNGRAPMKAKLVGHWIDLAGYYLADNGQVYSHQRHWVCIANSFDEFKAKLAGNLRGTLIGE